MHISKTRLAVVRALASAAYASQFRVVGVTRMGAVLSEFGHSLSIVSADLDKPQPLRGAVRGDWGVFSKLFLVNVHQVPRQFEAPSALSVTHIYQ